MDAAIMIDGVVTDTLMLDGKLFIVGMAVSLAGPIFAELEAAGVVSRETAPAPAAPAKTVTDPEELRGQVRAVIGQLEASAFDAETGAPKRAAIQAALPKGTKGVTDALVAEVWAGMKPAA